MSFVVRCIDEGDALFILVTSEEFCGYSRGLQLGTIVTGELLPAGWIVTKPLAKLRRGS